MTHLWLWFTSLIALSIVAPAAAQPTVLVRAETRIELRTERRPNQVVLLGALRDDLGSPLGGQAILLRLDKTEPRQTLLRRTVQTNGEGRFRVEVRVGRGDHELHATYHGDRGHEGARVSRSIDLDRAEVGLQVAVPNGGRLDLDQSTQPIDVQIVSQLNNGGITVEIVDEADRPLATGVSDPEGRVRFEIASGDLGSPGAGRIKARSRGDAHRTRAQTEVPVVRYRATTLSLTSPLEEVAMGDVVILAGRLSDSQGPLPDRAIGIFGDDEHLVTVLTETNGTYRAEVALEGREPGPLELVARFESASLGRGGSQSPLLTVAMGGASQPSWLWAALPLTLSLLVLALITRRAPRRLMVIPPSVSAAPKGIAPSLRSSRRPSDPAIAGRVLDGMTKSPIEGALVVLGELKVTTGRDGAFRIDQAPPGEHHLAVTAKGYRGERTTVSSPHRGEWAGFTVHLASLREQLLAPYRRIALALIPSSRLWGVWTNREVLAHNQGTQDESKSSEANDLGPLTAKVDEGFYSAEGPTEEDVQQVETAARRSEKEAPRPDPAQPRKS